MYNIVVTLLVISLLSSFIQIILIIRMGKVFDQFGELIKIVITGHQEAENLKIGILSNFISSNKREKIG